MCLIKLPKDFRIHYDPGMKRFLNLLVVAVLELAPPAWADGADDEYVSIDTLMQEADQMSTAGQAGLARAVLGEDRSGPEQAQGKAPTST